VRPDVIVVGLGTMGAAAVHELAGRGVRVLGLDRFAPPHDRGAHAGGSRIIRMAYMEGPAYVPLVRDAFRLWRELEAATGTTLLAPTGGLMLGRADSFAVAGALATAQAQSLPHELLDAAQVRRRFPAFVPEDADVGLYEEVAGLIRPEAAITALLERARVRGAHLWTGVTVNGWDADGAGVTVDTDRGSIQADRVVLAPGAWAPQLCRLEIPFRVQRRVQHYWRPTDPTLFEPGRLPAWIWSYGPAEAAYGLPAVDGVVKAAMHHGSETVDPDAGLAPARADEVEEMRRWLELHIPSLAAGGWLAAKPCLYTLTPDEHFVLGRHPEHPSVAVACGFSGHGFKFAPVVGEILADLVLEGQTTQEISLFDPTRFATRAVV
jgi:sarcosine oxidase